MAGLLVIGLLPIGRAVGRRDLHRGDLVFRTVGGPVGILRGDDVGLGVGVVEGGVDHAGGDAVGDQRPQRGFSGAAGEPDPVAVAYAALLGVVRMDFEPVFAVPDDIFGTPGLGADVVLAEDAPRGQQQRIARTGAFVGRNIFGDDELALAAHEAVDMHHWRTLRRLLVT